VVAIALLVAMEISDVGCNHRALGVVPGARADATTRIDCRPAALSLRAEIRMPCPVARACACGEVLANLIGPCEPAQISRAARIGREEEPHRLRRGLGCKHGCRAESGYRNCGKNQVFFLHDCPPRGWRDFIFGSAVPAIVHTLLSRRILGSAQQKEGPDWA